MISEKDQQVPVIHESDQHIPELTTPGMKERKWVGGAALMLVGAVLLLATLTTAGSSGEWLVPALGVIFLVWGILSSRSGPLIPGGILTGAGIGVVLAHQVFHLNSMDEESLITLSLGMGFLLILPLSAWFTPKWHWWPAIPGSVLVVVGGMRLLDNLTPEISTVLGKIWPLGLILAGGVLLWQVIRRK